MDAVKVAPCIVFIDEIDAIASRRDSSSTTRDRASMVQQLLTCIDDLNHVMDARAETQSHGHVVVIGATNRPEALDPAFRRDGRFGKEISLGANSHIIP
jgi:ribosome biogenesis ATPase